MSVGSHLWRISHPLWISADVLRAVAILLSSLALIGVGIDTLCAGGGSPLPHMHASGWFLRVICELIRSDGSKSEGEWLSQIIGAHSCHSSSKKDLGLQCKEQSCHRACECVVQECVLMRQRQCIRCCRQPLLPPVCEFFF